MVTDYDCWHPEHDVVDVAAVVAVMQRNAAAAQKLIAAFLRAFPALHEPCPIGSDRALGNAIMTAPSRRDPVMVEKLQMIAARVLAKQGA